MSPGTRRLRYFSEAASVVPPVRLALLASFLLGLTVRAGAAPPRATPWVRKPLVVVPKMTPAPGLAESPAASTAAPPNLPAPDEALLYLVRSDEVIVRERADKRARRLGSLRKGGLVSVLARDERGDCVDLEPRGTVCDASVHLMPVPRGTSAPPVETERYVFARAGTPELFLGARNTAFVPTAADFAFAKPRARKGAFRVVDEVEDGQERYVRTLGGRWLPLNSIEELTPSEFRGAFSATGFDVLPPLRHRGNSVVPRTALDDDCRALGRPCPVRLLEVDAGEGTLLAHERGRIVFATLVSVGKLGFEPLEERPRIPGGKTPLGVFPILGKHRSLTLTSDGSSAIFEDVPWTLHLTGPYAVHSAYWHDDFGLAKSGGCVNVSLPDGAFLFEWTTPRVPTGWHSALRGLEDEEPTLVWIHR